MKLNKIAFIGAGSMAEAIISGIISSNFIQADNIFVTNRANQERLKEMQRQYKVQCTHDKEKVINDADIIILSMKPADVKSAIEPIKAYLKSNQLIISVIAGISTSYLSNVIEKNVPVIRAMPNTSASIGYSATALCKGQNVTDQHIKMSESLFQTIGTTVIVAEEDMHTVTAVSGSGPAYVYYLVEAMEKAAVEAGLDQDIAKSLITQTVLGAGEMLEHSGKSARTLRENITSPSGTTEAGLKTLAKYDFEKAIIECVKSASDRSVELGKR